MQWPALVLCILFAAVLAGCAAPTGPEQLEPPLEREWVTEGWATQQDDARASYENRWLHMEAAGDSVGLGFVAEETIRFEVFELEIRGVFPEDRGNELSIGFDLWNQDTGERPLWFRLYGHDQYVSVGARALGGNLVTVRDVQYLLIPEPALGITIRTTEPVELPPGRWGFMAGGAPFTSVETSWNLPPDTAAQPVLASQSGCAILGPAQFDAMLSVKTVTGPTLVLDAFVDAEVRDGLQGFLVAGATGSSRVSLVFPDGSEETSDFGPTDAATISPFHAGVAGTYRFRIEHAVGATGGMHLTYCNILDLDPPLL